MLHFHAAHPILAIGPFLKPLAFLLFFVYIMQSKPIFVVHMFLLIPSECRLTEEKQHFNPSKDD